uniref:extracellular solute-binding protein n=1 Tax=uncultured Bifidobacterium sp. TaxID=165187 RepID=UPI002583C26D
SARMKFDATNGKGITVVGEQYPWDGGGYSQNLLTAAIGGGGPDVATFKLTATPSFVGNDLLAPLDEYINSWADKDQINENLYNTMRTAGELMQTYCSLLDSAYRAIVDGVLDAITNLRKIAMQGRNMLTASETVANADRIDNLKTMLTRKYDDEDGE